MSPRYIRPRPIEADDDTSGFSSGNDVLDDWLRRFALVNHASGGARTYVTRPWRSHRVAGFYALATSSVQHAEATPRAARGMPHSPIPAILLGRLAVDQKDQGAGLGSHLLRDAIARTLTAADAIGVRVLLVHAADENARSFYLNFDFEPSPTDPMNLQLLLKDARAIADNA